MFNNPVSYRRLTVLCVAVLMSGVAWAQDDANVRKDLTTVLALQAKPCGEVIKAERQGEDDYRVTCKSGDRYRVRVDENDRVVIDKID